MINNIFTSNHHHGKTEIQVFSFYGM